MCCCWCGYFCVWSLESKWGGGGWLSTVTEKVKHLPKGLSNWFWDQSIFLGGKKSICPGLILGAKLISINFSHKKKNGQMLISMSCVALCCVVMCCVVMKCVVLCFVLLWWIVFFCGLCGGLCGGVVFYVVCFLVLWRCLLYFIVLCCVVLCGVVWCCMVLCVVGWCCVVLCGVVLCCIVWFCSNFYDLVYFGQKLTWLGTV